MRKPGQMWPAPYEHKEVRRQDSHAQNVAIVGIARDLSDHLSLIDEFDAQVKNLATRDQQCKDLMVAIMEIVSALLEQGDICGAMHIISSFRETLEDEKKELRLECIQA